MVEAGFLFTMFVIFSGAALLSTLALFTRQSLLIAYILLGILLGPWGINLVTDASLIVEIGDAGVLFLLFLLGLHLDPVNMVHLLKKSTWVTCACAVLFMLMGYGIAHAFGFSAIDSLIVGLSLMFSSTIISLKLLPSGLVHNTNVGEFMISILLMQDIVAMITLLILPNLGGEVLDIKVFGLTILALPCVVLVSFVGERLILSPLFSRFERNREYLFLLAIAWCLCLSELCTQLGLSHEIGAFIAGVAIASDSRVSLYLAKSLEPLRDFFLILFFFSVGATYDLSMLQQVFAPLLLLVGVVLVFKPYAFRIFFVQVGETVGASWELGARLGQGSEFSLLLVNVALGSQILSAEAASLIQGVTVVSFILSSFWVVRYYQTPVNSKEEFEVS